MSEGQNKLEDVLNDWDNFSLESCELFFHQAEKMLDSVIQISDSFQSRAVNFLVFYIPTITAIFIYGISHLNKLSHSIPLGILFIGFFIACCRFLFILSAKQSFRTGSTPEKLIVKDWFRFKDEDNKQKKAILLNECKNYQKRIDYRINQNNKSGKQFNYAIRDTIISLFIASIIFIFTIFY